MENYVLQDLEISEMRNISGGGFAFDIGAVIGWMWRTQKFGPGHPLGIPYANAVWHTQYNN